MSFGSADAGSSPNTSLLEPLLRSGKGLCFCVCDRKTLRGRKGKERKGKERAVIKKIKPRRYLRPSRLLQVEMMMTMMTLRLGGLFASALVFSRELITYTYIYTYACQRGELFISNGSNNVLPPFDVVRGFAGVAVAVKKPIISPFLYILKEKEKVLFII
jgi:hypothetical protein